MSDSITLDNTTYSGEALRKFLANHAARTQAAEERVRELEVQVEGLKLAAGQYSESRDRWASEARTAAPLVAAALALYDAEQRADKHIYHPIALESWRAAEKALYEACRAYREQATTTKEVP